MRHVGRSVLAFLAATALLGAPRPRAPTTPRPTPRSRGSSARRCRRRGRRRPPRSSRGSPRSRGRGAAREGPHATRRTRRGLARADCTAASDGKERAVPRSTSRVLRPREETPAGRRHARRRVRARAADARRARADEVPSRRPRGGARLPVRAADRRAKAEWWTEVGASTVLGIVAAAKREWNVDENPSSRRGSPTAGPAPTTWRSRTRRRSRGSSRSTATSAWRGGRTRGPPRDLVNNAGLRDQHRPRLPVPLGGVEAARGRDRRAEGALRVARGQGLRPRPELPRKRSSARSGRGSGRAPRRRTRRGGGLGGARRRAPRGSTGSARVTVARQGDSTAFPSSNPLLPPGRVRLGINLDTAVRGAGRQESRRWTATASRRQRALTVGDVLVGLDDADRDGARRRGALAVPRSPRATRSACASGGAAGDDEVTGTFPQAEPEPAFPRGPLRGAIEVTREGNAFAATCGNVASFELLARRRHRRLRGARRRHRERREARPRGRRPRRRVPPRASRRGRRPHDALRRALPEGAGLEVGQPRAGGGTSNCGALAVRARYSREAPRRPAGPPPPASARPRSPRS